MKIIMNVFPVQIKIVSNAPSINLLKSVKIAHLDSFRSILVIANHAKMKDAINASTSKRVSNASILKMHLFTMENVYAIMHTKN